MLEDIKIVFDILIALATIWITFFQCLVSTVVFIVGGIWTYTIFIQKRQRYPRAEVTHDVVVLPLEDGKVLLHGYAKVTNKGDVLIRLTSGKVRLLQVLPLVGKIKDGVDSGNNPLRKGDIEFDWYQIESRSVQMKDGLCEIEPNEEEYFHFDFVIKRNIQAVQIYSHFDNIMKRKKNLGWSRTTIHQLDRET